MNHCSTAEERLQMIIPIIAAPKHGLVTQVSRENHVSRQSLYRWKEQAIQAMKSALGSPMPVEQKNVLLSILVLNLFLDTHASYRGIQANLRNNHGIKISLGTITGIIKEAGKRAQQWMNQQKADTERVLALDEQYSSQRGKAYLNVIDVHSGQVWATIPPVEVDGESWTLVLWYLQEQGINTSSTVSDGGRAIADALCQTQRDGRHQRDVWHLFHCAAQVQGRLDRVREAEQHRLEKLQKRAEAEASGKPLRGKRSKLTIAEQQFQLTQISSVADGVRYLCQELHTLLEVVVPRFAHNSAQCLTSVQRYHEIITIVALLDELALMTSENMQGHIQMLSKHIRLALPEALFFARQLDAKQDQARHALGSQAMALVAWAWLRRAWLGPTNQEVVQGFDPAWQAIAADLFATWDHAVRASSAVENWHSILRPYLSAHRKLSAGMLALLAVWQNHCIAPRGVHAGLSPLQRTASSASVQPWLAALGYSPLAA